MSDIDFLLLIVICFYASECLFRVMRGDVAFHYMASGRGRFWRAFAPLDRSNIAFVAGQPIAGLADTFVAGGWPVAIGEAGVLTGWSPDGPSTTSNWRRVIPFADLRDVRAVGRTVFVGPSELCTVDSLSRAARLAAMIAQLPVGDSTITASRLSEHLDRALDERGVVAAIREFRRETRLLRVLSAVLFALLVIALPTLLISLAFGRFWSQWLIATVGVWVMTLLEFRWSAAALGHLTRRERVQHLLLMIVTPLLAPRACDLLARDALAEFHPIAIASIVLPRSRYVEFAAKWLRRIAFAPAPSPDADPIAVQVDQSFRAALVSAIERHFTRTNVALEDVLRPPAREDESCRSFCPRCRDQFVVAEGMCEPCGVALVPFSQQA